MISGSSIPSSALASHDQVDELECFIVAYELLSLK